MKRFLAIILVLALALCLFVGCNGNDTDKTSTTTTTTTTVTTTAPSDDIEISPMMWRVTGKNGETMYLFGTIHVGDERNEEAFDLISDTFKSCDALAVEFDMVAYENNREQVVKDMSQYILNDGSVVSDYMPEELYKEAVDIMREAKIYSSTLKYYNLAMWSQLIDQAALEIYSELVSDYGMDNLLLDAAYDGRMEVLSVESGSFQASLSNSFSNELYILMMASTIEHIDEYGDGLDKLYTTWLSGDFDKLSKMINEKDYTDLTEDEIELIKDYYYKLEDERNVGMGDKAIEYLESGKTVFYAVGAAHMTGETGLVNRLTQEGYTVERIYLTETN